jgi:hypothetical protein
MTAFAEFGMRCVLDCGCPLSPPNEGGTLFWLRRLGVAQAPCSGAAGARGAGGGGAANLAQLLGERGPLGLPEGPNGPEVGSLWAAGGTARSRQDEPIERRPEEQGTQDAEKNEGMRIPAAMAIAPPSIWGAFPLVDPPVLSALGC